MTKVYKIHITGGESESPRSQMNPLPPEKGCGRNKQGTKEKDEGDTHKPDSQVSSSGGKQAEKSFSKKLKNVKEYFKGMKLFERCRRATSSITPRDMKEHMQKLGHHLKAGSDTYTWVGVFAMTLSVSKVHHERPGRGTISKASHLSPVTKTGK
ncbi:hypothetical protein PHYPO_G00121130 [Pangasianodon hypophthalmus]|uniref:Uncharacterized protein n=1 Tax=Pangasianodon hypophthalmus TaxID=310915 RepID=A0A5N5KZD0_PANHP|nr:hypothetical protein PHYPO_G00121130 [Pangasianodon hypophthalmus]